MNYTRVERYGSFGVDVSEDGGILRLSLLGKEDRELCLHHFPDPSYPVPGLLLEDLDMAVQAMKALGCLTPQQRGPDRGKIKRLVECESCLMIFHKNEVRQLKDMEDLAERLTPGREVPVGECDRCGSFVHPYEF